MAQTRKIEKQGILALSLEERKSLTLWVVVRVLQRPRNEYVNTKYTYSEGWYGTWQSLSGGYVVQSEAIKYYNQQIYHHYRIGDEILESLSCYSQHDRNFYSNISIRVNIPLVYLFLDNDMANSVYPPIDAFVFKLPEGCVIEVSCGGNPFKECVFEDGADTEPPENPPAPPGGGSVLPPVAPPPNAPPNTSPPGWGGQFEISPPYDGQNDGGLTYVPPVVPPWEGDAGQQEGLYYDVLIENKVYNYNGQLEDTRRQTFNRVLGKIAGVGSYDPDNSNAAYGIKHAGSQLIQLGLNYQFRTSPSPYFTGFSIIRILRVTLVP